MWQQRGRRQYRGDPLRQASRRRSQPVPPLLLWLFALIAATAISLLLMYYQLHWHSSSGQPAAVVKSIQALDDEPERLAQELPPACAARLMKAGLSAERPQTLARRRLYSDMSTSFQVQKLGSERVQGLGVSDLFSVQSGVLRPKLTRLEVPVRAIVLPVADPTLARLLAESCVRHLLPLFDDDSSVWLQNSKLLHSTVMHASTHMEPVPASPEDVDAEVAAVAAVAQTACPLRVVLERVVATSSGAVIACWQVVRGTDPSELRVALSKALPRASAHQTVQDRTILHTTLARIVHRPIAAAMAATGSRTARSGLRRSLAGGSLDEGNGAATEVVQRAVERMTQELCGVEATLNQLWFAQEQDKLALALDGEFTRHVIHLQCKDLQQ